MPRLTLEDVNKKTGGDENMNRRFRLTLEDVNKAQEDTGVDLRDDFIEGGVELDHSRSMMREYDNGHVQMTTERFAAWLAAFDGSGTAEAGFFDDLAHTPKTLALSNYRGWVNANRPQDSWGKPDYGNTNLYDAIMTGVRMAAAALKAPQMLDYVARTERNTGSFLHRRMVEDWKIPFEDLKPLLLGKIYYLFVQSDGGPNRGGHLGHRYKDAIRELLVRLSYLGIFIKFVYSGNDPDGKDLLDSFDELKVAAHPLDPQAKDVFPKSGEMVRYIDNVDTVDFPDGLGRVSDKEFSAKMTQELPGYAISAVRRGLLVARASIAS